MRQFLKDLAEQLRPHYLRLVRSSLRRAPQRFLTEWLEDRTLLAASLVRDINPSPRDGSPSELIDVNGTLYFAAFGGTSGSELWKSDGTTAGTVMLKDFLDGGRGSYPMGGMGAPNYVSVSGALFFTASSSTNGYDLWKSDGTTAGTGSSGNFVGSAGIDGEIRRATIGVF